MFGSWRMFEAGAPRSRTSWDFADPSRRPRGRPQSSRSSRDPFDPQRGAAGGLVAEGLDPGAHLNARFGHHRAPQCPFDEWTARREVLGFVVLAL